MASTAIAERRFFGAGLVALAAGLAWGAMLAAVPAGIGWLCGEVPPATVADAGRLAALLAAWAVMGIAMMLPCTALAGRPGRAALVLIPLAACGGAIVHWLCEAAGAMPPGAALSDPVLALLLVAMVAGLEFGKWRRPPGAVVPLVQMVALMLLGGPGDLLWMAVITLWMLADAAAPDRRTVLSRAAGFSTAGLAGLRRGARML